MCATKVLNQKQPELCEDLYSLHMRVPPPPDFNILLVLLPKLTLAFLCRRVSLELIPTFTVVASVTVNTDLLIPRALPRRDSTLVYI